MDGGSANLVKSLADQGGMDLQEPPGHLDSPCLPLTSGGRGGEHLLDESDFTVCSSSERTQVARLDPELLEPGDRLEDLPVLWSVSSSRPG